MFQLLFTRDKKLRKVQPDYKKKLKSYNQTTLKNRPSGSRIRAGRVPYYLYINIKQKRVRKSRLLYESPIKYL